MLGKNIVGKDFAIVNGVQIRICTFANKPGVWAIWTGSNGETVQIKRPTHSAVVRAIEPTMQHRRRTLGVDY